MKNIGGFVAIVALVLGTVSVKGQIFLRGACPNVTIQEDFNVEKYAGVWYEIERSFALFELGLKCVTAEYDIKEENKIGIVNRGVEISGIERVIDGVGTIADEKNKADLKVQLFGGVPFPVPYKVLSTDYENYSLVFSCLSVGIVHSENIWILGRKKEMSEEKITELKEILKSNGINPKVLNPVEQNCDKTEAKPDEEPAKE